MHSEVDCFIDQGERIVVGVLMFFPRLDCIMALVFHFDLHIRSSHGQIQLSTWFHLEMLYHQSSYEPLICVASYGRSDIFNFYLLMSQLPSVTAYGRQDVFLEVQA